MGREGMAWVYGEQSSIDEAVAKVASVCRKYEIPAISRIPKSSLETPTIVSACRQAVKRRGHAHSLLAAGCVSSGRYCELEVFVESIRR